MDISSFMTWWVAEVQWSHRSAETDDFDDYIDSEQDLIDSYADIDIEDSINIEIDSDASNWVWTTMTALLNTNAFVFGMIITILSVGVIKLIFNR